MRILHSSDSRVRRGYALMMTLAFLGVTLITISSLMWWASSNGKVTQKNELFTTAEAAAEADTEQVVAMMDRDWSYGQSLQAASVYANMTPPNTSAWPIQFQYSDGSNHLNVTSVVIATTNSFNALGTEYQGLSGYQWPCTVTSEATTVGQLYTVSATVQETVQATVIPLFQMAIFYNLNMDVSPGQPMNIGGNVFCNGTIYMWPYAQMTFSNNVDAAGWVTNQMEPDDQQSSSGYTAPTYLVSGQPMSKVDSLNMPVGTNNSPSAVESIINLVTNGLGAPNSGAYTTNGQIYLFNESDLIISNAATGLASSTPRGTNITIWYQDSSQATPLTQLTNDFYILTNRSSGNTYTTNYVSPANQTNVLYAGFSFVTNVVYYDYRESDAVQAVQVDVGALNTWLTNTAPGGGVSINRTSYADKGHGIDSMFIYNKVPMTASQLPAVRMVNGQQLPYTTDPAGSGRTTGGLTVTTPMPLYVKGNYNVQTATSAALASANTPNTTYTYPAALMGDAITALSANWRDTYTNNTALTSRTPSPTDTINAAALEGIVQSTNVGSNLYYSGGIENFLRLEENWSSSSVLTYNGSIVVMFPSIYATNFWQVPNNYYNPPTRQWGFDANFSTPSKLPHLSPEIYKIIRSSWTDY